MYMEGRKEEAGDEEEEAQGIDEETGYGPAIQLATVNRGCKIAPISFFTIIYIC